MEEICTALSAMIDEAGNGRYTIFYEEDLLEAIDGDMKNRETLEAALKTLRTGGYIDVKYARGNAFCVASLKKYVPVKKEEPAPAPVESAEERTSALSKKTLLSIGLWAFLGSFIGGAIVALITAVI